MDEKQIRLHYQQNYLLTQYTPDFTALVKKCADGFAYEKDSNAIHYHLVLFSELKPVSITNETYKSFSFDNIMEVLITNDFDEKIEEDDIDDDRGEPTNDFSSILLTIEDKEKVVEIKRSYTFFIKIKNNGKLAWPLPLTLSPTLNSTIFSADYPLARQIQPKEIAVFRINLIELDKKPIGEYKLFLQLKKGRVPIGPEFKYKFNKVE